MKRSFYYGLLIFVFSAIIGYYYSSVWKRSKDNVAVEYIPQNVIVSNRITLETVQTEEKISYNASFALKKYYDECRSFYFARF